MKQEMSEKKTRTLWLVGSGIWLANAGLNGWSMITRWEQLVNTGQATMRGLTVLLSLGCAALNFVNWYRRKNQE